MQNAQRFPIDVRTGWIDYSPALRHHASHRIRSLHPELASQIRAVTLRISDAEAHEPAQRRCDVEVMTTHAGPISASSVGVELFTLVDRAVDTLEEKLREHAGAAPYGELQRIA
jgi:ribosome-associated translation inhibitor RaiA